MVEVTMTDSERIAELETEVARLRAELVAERQEAVAWLAQRGAGESKFVFFRGVRAAYRNAATAFLCGEHRAGSLDAPHGVGDDT